MMKSTLVILSISLTLMILFESNGQNYDLLIKNGHLIDPKNGINQKMDIAINNGKIAAVEKFIIEGTSKKIIDAKGLIISPGLLDIHSHNFHGTESDNYLSNSYSALPPDGFTFKSGITTIVDVGGAGWRNFKIFKEQTIDRSKTRVLSFLNIVGNGMKGGAIEQNLDDMNPKLTALVAKQFKKHIVGVKLAHYSGFDWTPIDRVVQAGTLADIPVMIDFGGSVPELSLEKLLLEKLRPGDIFTHTYAHVKGRIPIVNENKKVLPFVFKAQKKGIVFDVGHGGGSFLFEQAIPALKQGLKPNSISTDLHTGSMNGGMKDLLNVMSKFLNLEMPLQEVIAATTWRPAIYIKRRDLGNLSVGSVADIAILNLLNGTFGFVDTSGKKIRGSQKLVCEMTFRAGKIMYDLNGLASPLWNE